MEKEVAGDYPWFAEAWKKAREAVVNGNVPPDPVIRHPVILTPDGPISSASQLQQLAETESLPETIVTNGVTWDGQEIEKVTICSLEHEEWMRMMKKADTNCSIPGILPFVVFEGRQRIAWAVTALKEGVTLGDEKDGNSEGGN
jgi:hypothetical protein